MIARNKDEKHDSCNVDCSTRAIPWLSMRELHTKRELYTITLGLTAELAWPQSLQEKEERPWKAKAQDYHCS